MENSAFEKVRSSRIPSLNLELQQYVHRATGARHLHFATQDRNNGFVVAFLTVPVDSTGVAHILEHTSLCGSERYPVRDPFFMMLRRSLATFMNAFTSSDWTAYPFATQNDRDFDNLLGVYLDAVFFPRLDTLDFSQEGHRLEPADPSNPASPLVIKGVVYNEMKGVMSQPTSRLYQEMTARLFPTTTYHHNHGGDPASIPELTHEQLVAFHARHYHPSNAVIMTWGDIPASRHQQRLEELALSRFGRLELDLGLTDEIRYDAPRSFEAAYPLGPGEDPTGKTHVVLGWLLGLSTDLSEMMNAQLVTDVLIAHSGSPLRRALETTDLGTSPSALTGMQSSTREATFFCGIEGSEPDRAEAVERLVMDTLAEVADRGVDPDQVQAVLHQLELTQREIGGGEFPYGLQIMVQTLPAVLHGGDPVAFLDVDPVLEELNRRIADPDYVRTQVRSLLVQNTHRVRVCMRPDPGLAEAEAAAERELTQRLEQGLSDRQRVEVIERAASLARRQEEKPDPEVLPRVGIADIPADVPIPRCETTTVSGIETSWYTAGTNGLVYLQLALELPALDEGLVERLSLFTTCLTEVGCAGRGYLETQALQSAVSGGVGARTRVRGTREDVHSLSSFFSLGTKALARNIGPATRLLADTFESARFDEISRLRELVAQVRAIRERSIVGQGHALAMKAASAGLAPQADLGHRLSGLASVKALRTLADSLSDESAAAGFAAQLGAIRDRLLEAPRRLVMVAERAHRDEMQSAAAEAFDRAPDARGGPFGVRHTTSMVRQAWTTSTAVSFCAKAWPTVAPSHADAPALTLLGPLLRNGFLHTAVREKGGAYGSGASYDADSGSFRFFSYRDPRLGETLADFDRSVQWVTTAKLEERLLEEALLNVIGTMDRPDPPAGEALGTFYMGLHGRTPEVRRAFRSSILSVTLRDVRRVAETYLVPGAESIAVLTDPTRLAAEPSLDLEVVELS